MTKKPATKPRPRRPATRRASSPRNAAPDLDARGILLEASAKIGEVEVAQLVGRSQAIAARAARPELASVRADILDLLALLQAHAAGRPPALPFGRVAAIAGALSYLLSPVDLIPDFIPGLGYSDDAAVIAECVRLVRRELEAFRSGRRAQ